MFNIQIGIFLSLCNINNCIHTYTHKIGALCFFRWSHFGRIGCDNALFGRDTSAAPTFAAGRTQASKGTRNMRGDIVRYPAATESDRSHSCGRREKEGMGATLDYKRFSCYRKTSVYIGWKILCGWWNFNSRLLFGATSVQCQKVNVLFIHSENGSLFKYSYSYVGSMSICDHIR